MSEKFQFIPTGKRQLTGLQATWKGSNGSFQSGQVQSQLFGQALQVPTGSSLYFDVTDDSLSFTGTSSVVSSFTMGAFFWGPNLNNKVWFLIVPHNAAFTSDLYQDFMNWRLALFLYQDTAHEASLAFTNEAGNAADYLTLIFAVPTELRNGWIHLAISYNQSEQGGTVRGYLNGIKYYERNNSALIAYGNNGAYDFGNDLFFVVGNRKLHSREIIVRNSTVLFSDPLQFSYLITKGLARVF